MNFVSALKIQASAGQKCSSRPITCDFSTDAVCLSHIGLISIPLSRSLSPCWKNSSMILSVHCRYSSRDFVGLLKSAQCTIFRRTCNYINQKTHKIKWEKRTVSSCICLLNTEHLTTRRFDYATAYKNIHIETSPYMRPAATVCLKSRTCSLSDDSILTRGAVVAMLITSYRFVFECRCFPPFKIHFHALRWLNAPTLLNE